MPSNQTNLLQGTLDLLILKALALEEMHGLGPGAFGKTFESFIDCIHPDDRQRTIEIIDEATRSRRDATRA